VLQTKPVYEGNAQAIYTHLSYPQIATVRSKAITPLGQDSSRQGKVITIDAGLNTSAIRTTIVEEV